MDRPDPRLFEQAVSWLNQMVRTDPLHSSFGAEHVARFIDDERASDVEFDYHKSMQILSPAGLTQSHNQRIRVS